MTAVLSPAARLQAWQKARTQRAARPAAARPQEPYELLILVPYRDRLQHLRVFGPKLAAFLERRRIPFTIGVVHQCDEAPFNRGKLINAGFLENPGGTHIVAHDVDLVPQDPSCNYHPSPTPLNLYCRHVPFQAFFGGIVMLTREHYQKVNGFSNEYWGWGQEDDELRERLRHAGLRFTRRTGNWRCLPHVQSHSNRSNVSRFRAFRKGLYNPAEDGINSCRYTVLRRLPVREFLSRKGIGVLLHDRHFMLEVELQYEERSKTDYAAILPSEQPAADPGTTASDPS